MATWVTGMSFLEITNYSGIDCHANVLLQKGSLRMLSLVDLYFM